MTTKRLVVPWPRYPVITRTGRPSQSKRAGMLVPWLSANMVNNLAHPIYRDAVTRWRETASLVAHGRVAVEGRQAPEGDHYIVATLHKRTAKPMDSLAIIEGLKPIIDGWFEALGADDNCIVGAHAYWAKAKPGEERVELGLVRWGS